MKKVLTILMAVICVFSLCAVDFVASAAEADESARSSASAPLVSDFSFSELFSPFLKIFSKKPEKLQKSY